MPITRRTKVTMTLEFIANLEGDDWGGLVAKAANTLQPHLNEIRKNPTNGVFEVNITEVHASGD